LIYASSIATYLLAYYEDHLVLEVRELRRFGSIASRFDTTDLTIIGINVLSIISAIYVAGFLNRSSNGLQLIEFLLIAGAIYTFSLTIYNILSKLRKKKATKATIELLGLFVPGWSLTATIIGLFQMIAGSWILYVVWQIEPNVQYLLIAIITTSLVCVFKGFLKEYGRFASVEAKRDDLQILRNEIIFNNMPQDDMKKEMKRIVHFPSGPAEDFGKEKQAKQNIT
jgi:hypothetical protein